MKKAIYEVLSKAKIGDKVSDGKRSWTVVETLKTGDCTIAIPVKPFKGSKPFELWADAQSKVSYIKHLKIVK